MPALLFLAYFAAEIATLVLVGHFIGVFPTILLLIAGSAAGLILVRSQGRRVFEGFRKAARGEIEPSTAVADGALVTVGAVLMFVPGLLTSFLGLLALTPVTRFLFRPIVAAFAARRLNRVATAVGPFGYRNVVIDPDGEVIDATVVSEYYDDGQGRTTYRAIDPN
ncbi:FxsA family protein [Nocardia huaxiensis]|uniref:FxsA family protein n=1 Tax=Nocardia huaxiensis TaxID=2755382 RepID=A0A7D6VEL7_9NOCA|nr:FxsA family protein [Nocardia huaxiensis]QLY27930.1 FxsA family protein [Nocardia huaxiensis]UFS98659.1 FxsA family protein [Nocardia huaxiensis]